VTQSRLNTAGRLAAATAILVGGGLSIANPVGGTVDASAPGTAPAPALVTVTELVEKGGGQWHGAKGHHHGSGADRGQGAQRAKKGERATNHEGMNHDGMHHEVNPDRGTHRQKSR
jgi:hypothetical protein